MKRSPDPLVEFGDTMEEFLSFLKEQSVETIVLSQPSLWKERMSSQESGALWLPINTAEGPVRLSDGDLARAFSKYNVLQQEIARRIGADFVDLDRNVPKTLDYFFDDVHFTDKGSEQVAQAIFPEAGELVAKALRRKKVTLRTE